VEPTLTARYEDGRDTPLLLWRWRAPLLAISSGPLGGGIGERRWVVNATVPMSYARDDPDAHLAQLARGLGLRGPGVGLLTGVDVARMRRAADTAVVTWATVGLGAPEQAARYGGDALPDSRVGTINIVVWLPARLNDAALVNAVATATEAKAQALRELGVAGTGTATDAVCVLCPTAGPAQQYGGPRSLWGARLARSVHRAVLAGGAADLADGVPWSVAQRPGTPPLTAGDAARAAGR
jgi:adenosylcobinamide amidohydrolase